MKTRAAVAFKAKNPLEVVLLDLEGPKEGEVLVEIKATGICHTDAYTLDGLDSEGLFPSVLGHEGAGVVREIGPGVTTIAVDDHVIPLYTPECRQCKSCLSGKTNLCTAIRATQGKGLMPDGTSRFRYKGKPVHHYMGCSTFSNFTVVPEIALAKIRKDAPFEKSCYIGCGVTTGIGAVVNTAKVEPGANCIVFGLGGIGLNVIQGLRLVGADKIVGVDINDAKEDWGRRFGMTHFVNPKKIEGDLVQHLIALTEGGADYSFDCTGNTTVMRQALEACHRGWGVSIVIGVAEAGKEIATRPFQLVTGRVWKGSAFGGARGRTDVPKIVDWYPKDRLIHYRDGLMIALLAYRPLRLKNFSSIRIGEQLVKIQNRYWLVFPASQMGKSRRPFEAEFPEALLPHLLRYLDYYRPLLMQCADNRTPNDPDALWISERATPLDQKALGARICKHTKAAFGQSLCAHLFRDAGATTIAVDTPKYVRDSMHILGHADLAMTEDHYILAEGLVASRKQNHLVESLIDFDQT